jgi:hypothetical protein
MAIRRILLPSYAWLRGSLRDPFEEVYNYFKFPSSMLMTRAAMITRTNPRNPKSGDWNSHAEKHSPVSVIAAVVSRCTRLSRLMILAWIDLRREIDPCRCHYGTRRTRAFNGIVAT